MLHKDEKISKIDSRFIKIFTKNSKEESKPYLWRFLKENEFDPARSHIPTYAPFAMNQIGPTCGLKALELAAQYRNPKLKLYTNKSQIPKQSTQHVDSLFSFAKQIKATSMGAIYNVHKLEDIAKHFNLHDGYSFKYIHDEKNAASEDTYIQLLCEQLRNGYSIIISTEIDNNNMPNSHQGYHTHWALLWGYVYIDGQYYFLVSQYGKYYLWSAHNLFMSNRNLPQDNPHAGSYYKVAKGQCERINEKYPAPVADVKNFREITDTTLENFKFTGLALPTAPFNPSIQNDLYSSDFTLQFIVNKYLKENNRVLLMERLDFLFTEKLKDFEQRLQYLKTLTYECIKELEDQLSFDLRYTIQTTIKNTLSENPKVASEHIQIYEKQFPYLFSNLKSLYVIKNLNQIIETEQENKQPKDDAIFEKIACLVKLFPNELSDEKNESIKDKWGVLTLHYLKEKNLIKLEKLKELFPKLPTTIYQHALKSAAKYGQYYDMVILIGEGAKINVLDEHHKDTIGYFSAHIISLCFSDSEMPKLLEVLKFKLLPSEFDIFNEFIPIVKQILELNNKNPSSSTKINLATYAFADLFLNNLDSIKVTMGILELYLNLHKTSSQLSIGTVALHDNLITKIENALNPDLIGQQLVNINKLYKDIYLEKEKICNEVKQSGIPQTSTALTLSGLTAGSSLSIASNSLVTNPSLIVSSSSLFTASSSLSAANSSLSTASASLSSPSSSSAESLSSSASASLATHSLLTTIGIQDSVSIDDSDLDLDLGPDMESAKVLPHIFTNY